MKNKIRKIIIFSLLTSLLLTGCTTTQTTEFNTKQIDKEVLKEKLNELNEVRENKETNKTETSDTTNLYQTSLLLDDNYNKENILFSPLSINMAIAMTTNGASDETLKELENYLCTDISTYNSFSKDYLSNTNDSLKIANAIWTSSEDKYLVSTDYENLVKTYYSAESTQLDFQDENAYVTINDWVNEKTEGMIPTIVGPLPMDTTMVLTNALYFKSQWIEPFDKELTEKSDFANLDGSISSVDMMSDTVDIYYENDYAIGFEKEYIDGYSFIAILPKQTGDFALSEINLDDFLSLSESATVNIKMPKFEYEYETELQNNFQNLGIQYPFSNDAQFGGMLQSGENLMKIDLIIHKTKIVVDEEGTEASASTAIVMTKCTSAFEDMEEPKEVILDRPFAFIIMDNKTNTPLFIGKVIEL